MEERGWEGGIVKEMCAHLPHNANETAVSQTQNTMVAILCAESKRTDELTSAQLFIQLTDNHPTTTRAVLYPSTNFTCPVKSIETVFKVKFEPV